MKPLIIEEKIEVYQPHTKEYWVRTILGFDKWVEENYQKYHKKNDNR